MSEMQNCEAKITDIYLQSRMNKPTITEKLLYQKKKKMLLILGPLWHSGLWLWSLHLERDAVSSQIRAILDTPSDLYWERLFSTRTEVIQIIK